MRWLILALLAGCSSAALPTPAVAVQHSPQCIWHFTDPADTSDSDETPGVSSCSGDATTIHDGIIDIAVTKNGEVMVGQCHAASHPVGSNATYWFADVDACGLVGSVGVNL